MKRIKADGHLHAHGKPLRAPATPDEQLLFEDFGLSYRERLLAVEHAALRARLAATEPST